MATASRIWHSRLWASSVAFLTPFMGSRGSGRLLTGEGGVGFQGAEHRVVDRGGLGQDGLGLGAAGQEGEHFVIARQPDAAGGQLGRGLGGPAARC